MPHGAFPLSLVDSPILESVLRPLLNGRILIFFFLPLFVFLLIIPLAYLRLLEVVFLPIIVEVLIIPI